MALSPAIKVLRRLAPPCPASVMARPDSSHHCYLAEPIGDLIQLLLLGGTDHMDENEFVGDFVYLCETSGLDPVEAVRILNAQDWDDEELGFTMAMPITIHEDFV